jgi:hypothetical protein
MKLRVQIDDRVDRIGDPSIRVNAVCEPVKFLLTCSVQLNVLLHWATGEIVWRAFDNLNGCGTVLMTLIDHRTPHPSVHIPQ